MKCKGCIPFFELYTNLKYVILSAWHGSNQTHTDASLEYASMIGFIMSSRASASSAN
jgi:hypothetical protein